ncbi:hypothetical protein Q9L42_019410 [Methylomarinum sp. Ch1-1]|uniref:Uncharacterized protein n=1 Tax=Methylomarinum roseum TaxID=3067653 RepID=A0AAU7NU23_9GAMM|nr:hypothetical protein [Methylomarinum sp. Ch1-1]MDP4519437.1 hypothetical protein [Methylomarinum sp. Ch1-1]
MNSNRINTMDKQDMSQLHAATCLLMTRFINGYHCPKLSHVIVQQLQKLLAHPVTQRNVESREMYSRLLEHWQNVSISLIEQKKFVRQSQIYH